MRKWQTKEDLINLLAQLVGHASVTGSEAEIAIASFIKQQLSCLPYFEKHSDFLELHPMEDGRQFLTALVKKDNAKETVILISHFDVVDVEDYGGWKHLAFSPLELTKKFHQSINSLPSEVQADLENGEWLFGRGVMDMKAGLALHLAMIEKATLGEFSGNLLLLTVPDEEVNSAGMINAVPALVKLAEKFDLDYKACVNSEPMFAKYPGDKNHYLYTGSVGKVLPGFFCYGMETHVGEPFSGLNANYMASEITRELELNPLFCEQVFGETTTPPTNLMQKDLKEGYSVQIPHAAIANFNLMIMNKSMQDITAQLVELAKRAARKIENHFFTRAEAFSKLEHFQPDKLKVNVFTYSELYKEACKLFGEAEIERRQQQLYVNRATLDDRDYSVKIVNDLASMCKELTPMIVVMFSPPYYPAVASAGDPLIEAVVEALSIEAKKQGEIFLQRQHYFPGLCDLSFAGYSSAEASLSSLTSNMPIYGKGYTLPIRELEALRLPVLNIGPVGRDAHKWTERLDSKFAFETLFELLPFTIKHILTEAAN